MSGKFEIAKSKNDKFFFNLKASNGQVILTSQMYESMDAAKQGIESVKSSASQDQLFERKKSSKGEPYFDLKASNGQNLGRSEMYSSGASMENGIASVKTNAPGASVTDLTQAEKK